MRRTATKVRIVVCFVVCVVVLLSIVPPISEYFWLYRTHKELYGMLCSDGSTAKDSIYFGNMNSKQVFMSKCILDVPGIRSVTHFTPFLESNIEEQYLKLPDNVQYTDEVLILTPLRDADEYLVPFADLLNTLSYPHHLIRICFAEEGSVDNTYETGRQISQILRHKYGFKNATIVKLPITGNNISREQRHNDSIQMSRRSHMAKARNMLTSLALQNERWILWIDVDVVKIRPDTVQQFLFSGHDVMVSSTLREVYSFSKRSMAIGNYDFNSFNETIFDGKAYRLYTHDFKGQGRSVPIQFVGACVLMIKSDCVRKGLHFPESVITSPESHVNAIESEGLGMLARKMGFGVYVLPFLESFHV